MISKIDHIGIAVRSLDEAVALYEKAFGFRCRAREDVASQNVRVAFFQVGEVEIELLEPIDEEGPIAKFLASHGPGVHHIAYATDDLKAQLGEASGAGCKLINTEPFDGAHGKLVAFLHPKSTFGVLTEFCARKR